MLHQSHLFEATYNVGGLVAGTIVDNNDFGIVKIFFAAEQIERMSDSGLLVVGRNDHTDFWGDGGCIHENCDPLNKTNARVIIPAHLC